MGLGRGGRGGKWPGPGLTAAGWTDIDVATPGSGGVAVYCDNSMAGDGGNGLTPATAKKLTASAVSVLNSQTQNKGHRLLFKRGETWTDQRIVGITRDGASADDPLVIGYYGSSGARPKINHPSFAGGGFGGLTFSGGSTGGSYVAVIGIHLSDYTRDPSLPVNTGTSVTGLGHLRSSNWFLVEDSIIEWFGTGLTMQTDKKKLAIIRRSIIVETWPTFSPGQTGSGLYFDTCSTALLEENFINHNGYREDEAATHREALDHNVYCKAKTGFAWNNIIANSASDGIQWRGEGGITKDNLFFKCPIAHLVAGDSARGNNLGRVYDNVVLEGCDRESVPAGWGLNFGGDFGHVGASIDCRRNIIANATGTNSVGVVFTKTFGANASGNVFYNLDSGLTQNGGSSGNTGSASGVNMVDLNANNVDDLSSAALGFPDPTISLDDYAVSIGMADADEFIQACRDREIGTWNEQLTAHAVNNYIRVNGFNMAAVRKVNPHRRRAA